MPVRLTSVFHRWHRETWWCSPLCLRAGGENHTRCSATWPPWTLQTREYGEKEWFNIAPHMMVNNTHLKKNILECETEFDFYFLSSQTSSNCFHVAGVARFLVALYSRQLVLVVPLLWSSSICWDDKEMQSRPVLFSECGPQKFELSEASPRFLFWTCSPKRVTYVFLIITKSSKMCLHLSKTFCTDVKAVNNLTYWCCRSGFERYLYQLSARSWGWSPCGLCSGPQTLAH